MSSVDLNQLHFILGEQSHRGIQTVSQLPTERQFCKPDNIVEKYQNSA